jgi:hypothetical protein
MTHADPRAPCNLGYFCSPEGPCPKHRAIALALDTRGADLLVERDEPLNDNAELLAERDKLNQALVLAERGLSERDERIEALNGQLATLGGDCMMHEIAMAKRDALLAAKDTALREWIAVEEQRPGERADTKTLHDWFVRSEESSKSLRAALRLTPASVAEWTRREAELSKAALDFCVALAPELENSPGPITIKADRARLKRLLLAVRALAALDRTEGTR